VSLPPSLKSPKGLFKNSFEVEQASAYMIKKPYPEISFNPSFDDFGLFALQHPAMVADATNIYG